MGGKFARDRPTLNLRYGTIRTDDRVTCYPVKDSKPSSLTDWIVYRGMDAQILNKLRTVQTTATIATK